MIPILYDSNEIYFTSNGLGRLRDCISCTVTEERNGIYECDFEYPVGGAHYDLIKLGRIIGVSHDDGTVSKPFRYRGPLSDEQEDILTDENGVALTGTGTKYVSEYDIQPFDIVSYSRPINGMVTFHAVHISYRQSKMVTYGSNVTSLADAFDIFDTVFFPDNPLGQDAGGNPFTYITDKSNTGYCAAFDGTPKTIRSLLGGTEGSILDTYGGEFEWDKWIVRLHKARGIQRDFTIRYGVNMSDFRDDTDYSESFNTCIPFWANGTLVVIGDEVSSENKPIGIGDKCVPLDFSDRFETQPSKTQLEYAALSAMSENRTYLPKQTIDVDFVRLQDEAGYDDFDKLLECKLCDSIKVVFPGYDMSAYYKIVKTEWNVLLDRYESMELGNLSTTLAEALGIDTGSSAATAKAVVVESGTAGIWNYRKWSDGISECWGIASAELSPYYSGGGFYGYQTGLTAFPTGAFNAVPVVNVDGKIGNGFYLGSLIDDISSSQFNAKVMSTDAGPANCTFYIHAIGNWK